MKRSGVWAVEYSSQDKWLRVDREEKIFEWEWYLRCSSGRPSDFITLGDGYKSEEVAIAAAKEFILTYRLDLSGTIYKYL